MERIRWRQRDGELTGDVEAEFILLLAHIVTFAPIALPQIVEAIYGVDPLPEGRRCVRTRLSWHIYERSGWAGWPPPRRWTSEQLGLLRADPPATPRRPGTLHLVTTHQGRTVPTVGGILLFGTDEYRSVMVCERRVLRTMTIEHIYGAGIR